MKDTTKILSEEHKIILRVIAKLKIECDAITSGKQPDSKFLLNAIDFIRNYADKFHHAKEEDILFKEFSKLKNLHCNPVDQMLYEHDLGRKFVKEIEQGLNEKDKNKITEGIRNYAGLLEEHIYKEDNILYPMIEAEIDDKNKKIILEKFKEINVQKKKENEKYLKFADESK